ncbi:MAG TPA: YHS domain-containing protein [Candidatus Angelobacter sp.]|jgi:YHS domain-containing protein|nr:YHS domain-containing protein [Candidatus Angelobacter sp.]HLZ00228.1 YHS domain-containing protein [Candidatus Angelobacter sp.]
MPVDPVCKSHVHMANAAASFDYHDETVYFCSLECAQKFEEDPEFYMRGMSDEERIAS